MKKNFVVKLADVMLNLAARNPVVRKLVVGATVLAVATCNAPTKPEDNSNGNPTGPWDFDPCAALTAEMPGMAKMASDNWVVDNTLMADSAAACTARKGRWNPQDANCVDTAGLPNPAYDEFNKNMINFFVSLLQGAQPATGYPKERGQYASDSDCFADNGIENNLADDVNYALCFKDNYSPESDGFVFARFPTVKRENLRVSRKVWGVGDIDEDYAHLFHCLQANGIEGDCRLSKDGWYANISNSPEPNPCANNNAKGVCKQQGTSVLENPRVIPPNDGRGCR